MMTGKRLRARAFAKINLMLNVLGTRPDGYHELRTIFQSLALHDTLSVTVRRGPLTLDCDDPRCPGGEANLVWRAASSVWRAAGRRGPPHGLRVHLRKRIPLDAGLGGGSSDAAAALRVCGVVWRVGDERLRAIARELGADVPYFFEGGTALGLERGDLLFPLLDTASRWVVLAVPTFGVSTKDAFGWFDDDRRAPMQRRRSRTNDLQAPVVKRHPEIRRLAGSLARAGATLAAMSGSGSAVFGLFGREIDARRAAEVVATDRRNVIVTRTIGRTEYTRQTRPHL